MKVKIKSDLWNNYNNLGHLGIKVGAVVEVEDEDDVVTVSSGLSTPNYYKLIDIGVRILKADCIEINKLRFKKIKRVLK